MRISKKSLSEAMNLALLKAQKTIGATAPNPPVGAIAIGKGKILGSAVHEKAGSDHAERALLLRAMKEGWVHEIEALGITLEPCSHHGKTPPCTDIIIENKIPFVFVGTVDPNPLVSGKGIEVLRKNNIEVEVGIEKEQCDRLIAPFRKWILTGLPYVVLKVALNESGSMIPDIGKKTFTSPSSLKLAHELRKECDAIVTGSETVLKDQPLFTVRHINDHAHKRRSLLVMDRRKRIPKEKWCLHASKDFDLEFSDDIEGALARLGEKGCLKVLVEAGPRLNHAFEALGLWDEKLVIQKRSEGPDEISWVYNIDASPH